MTISTILVIVALICFLLGAFPQVTIPLNLMSLGLFFATLAWLLSSGVMKIG